MNRCRYPEFSSYVKRCDSFERRDDNNADLDTHRRYALIGFFYSGIVDLVICHHCGLALHSWRDRRAVLTEHLYWDDTCCFVRRAVKYSKLCDCSRVAGIHVKKLNCIVEKGILLPRASRATYRIDDLPDSTISRFTECKDYLFRETLTTRTMMAELFNFYNAYHAILHESKELERAISLKIETYCYAPLNYRGRENLLRDITENIERLEARDSSFCPTRNISNRSTPLDICTSYPLDSSSILDTFCSICFLRASTKFTPHRTDTRNVGTRTERSPPKRLVPTRNARRDRDNEGIGQVSGSTCSETFLETSPNVATNPDGRSRERTTTRRSRTDNFFSSSEEIDEVELSEARNDSTIRATADPIFLPRITRNNVFRNVRFLNNQPNVIGSNNVRTRSVSKNSAENESGGRVRGRSERRFATNPTTSTSEEIYEDAGYERALRGAILAANNDNSDESINLETSSPIHSFDVNYEVPESRTDAINDGSTLDRRSKNSLNRIIASSVTETSSVPVATTGSSTRQTDDFNCVICYSNLRNVLYLPCRHLIACTECSGRMKECPVCKSTVYFKIDVFY